MVIQSTEREKVEERKAKISTFRTRAKRNDETIIYPA